MKYVKKGILTGLLTALVLSVVYSAVAGLLLGGVKGAAGYGLFAAYLGVVPSLIVGLVSGAIIGLVLSRYKTSRRGGWLVGMLIGAVLLGPIFLMPALKDDTVAFWFMFGAPALIAILGLGWTGSRVAAIS